MPSQQPTRKSNHRLIQSILCLVVHVRKRNTLVNGPIVTGDHVSHSETAKRKHRRHEAREYNVQQNTSWIAPPDVNEETKLVRPYFLIRPQSVLLLPNETGKLSEDICLPSPNMAARYRGEKTLMEAIIASYSVVLLLRSNSISLLAKFKCCFGGDPLPTIVWSHNDSRIPEILAAGGPTSSQYRTHKLHDIYYMDIGPISVRDNGQIKCTIMNRLGREEAIAQLIVARKQPPR